MDPQDILNRIWAFFGSESWVSQVFVIVLSTLFLSYLQRRILTRLHQRLRKTRTHWDDSVIDALRRPLSALIWIVGLAFAVEVIRAANPATIFDAVGPLRDVGIISCLAWFLIGLIRRAEQNLIAERIANGEEFDRSTLEAITKLLRASVFITTGLVILQTLGFSISGVLAFGGIGGIAIGFAAKDMLANFFGGLTIYMDRPFTVGDWIRSPDRELEGTVETIGWRRTVIRTFDKRPLYVPNATFTSIAVENPSRMLNRRINETIGIRYDDADKLADIIKDVKDMLESHPEIDTSQTLMVNFTSFAPSSLDFFIYTFTRTTVWTHYQDVKQDVLLRILDIITAHGAEVAFPTSTIHLWQEPAVQQGG